MPATLSPSDSGPAWPVSLYLGLCPKHMRQKPSHCISEPRLWRSLHAKARKTSIPPLWKYCPLLSNRGAGESWFSLSHRFCGSQEFPSSLLQLDCSPRASSLWLVPCVPTSFCVYKVGQTVHSLGSRSRLGMSGWGGDAASLGDLQSRPLPPVSSRELGVRCRLLPCLCSCFSNQSVMRKEKYSGSLHFL